MHLKHKQLFGDKGNCTIVACEMLVEAVEATAFNAVGKC